ncbi:MAG: hypothetical protein E6J55_05040 [Deltaproteobacteria bacterium]|nr:MAG: hypothetical protein E6J55_05040 [Deltaproteobacteria bacterium]
MMPSGAVIPDPTYQLSIPVGGLLGPIATLGLLSTLVVLVVIVACAVRELRRSAVSQRVATRQPEARSAQRAA